MADTVQQLLRTRIGDSAPAVKYGDRVWSWREHLTDASAAASALIGIADPDRPLHVGALLGNIVSNWARQRFQFGKIAISMLWLEALMFPLYALAPNALIMACIAAAEEFVSPMYTISFESYRLMTTPDAMPGRTSSTVQWVTQGAQSLGAIIGGILIQAIGARWSALLWGLWLVLLAIVTTLNKRVRRASLRVSEAVDLR